MRIRKEKPEEFSETYDLVSGALQGISGTMND